MAEAKDEKKDEKGTGPAPANQASPQPKPVQNRAQADAAEKTARAKDDDPNAQTGGTAGGRKSSETVAGYATDPYVENPDFVPNPTDHYGTVDTTGAGSHEDSARLVNPLLGKDETVLETLPDVDKERLTVTEPLHASDGSHIVRPERTPSV